MKMIKVTLLFLSLFICVNLFAADANNRVPQPQEDKVFLLAQEIESMQKEYDSLDADNEKRAVLAKDIALAEAELEQVSSDAAAQEDLVEQDPAEASRKKTVPKQAEDLRFPTLGQCSREDLVFVIDRLFDKQAMTTQEKVIFESFTRLINMLVEQGAEIAIDQLVLMTKQAFIRLERLTVGASMLASTSYKAVFFPLERVDVQHVTLKVLAYLINFIECNFDAVIKDSSLLEGFDLAHTIIDFLPNRMKRYAWRRALCCGNRRVQAKDAVRVRELLSYDMYEFNEPLCDDYLKLVVCMRDGDLSQRCSDLMQETMLIIIESKQDLNHDAVALTCVEVLRMNLALEAQRVKLAQTITIDGKDPRAEICIRHAVLCDDNLLTATCDEDFLDAYLDRYKALVDQYLNNQGTDSFSFKYELFALASHLKRFRDKAKIAVSTEKTVLSISVNFTSSPLEWCLNKCASFYYIVAPVNMTSVYMKEMIEILELVATKVNKIESKDEVVKANGLLSSVLSGNWAESGKKTSYLAQAKGIILNAINGNLSDLQKQLTGALGGTQPLIIAAVLYMVMPALSKMVKPLIKKKLLSWVVENNDPDNPVVPEAKGADMTALAQEVADILRSGDAAASAA